MHHPGRTCLFTLAVLLTAYAPAPQARRQAPAAPALAEPLGATPHPVLPKDPFRLWLAPAEAARRSSALANFGTGARLFTQARYAEALPLVSARLAGSPLAQYAAYYRGLTELRLSRVDAARQTLAALQAESPVGYLAEAVRLRLAELAESQGDHAEAAALYKVVAAGKPVSPEDVLLKLASALQASGDASGAAQAWARVYYEFPLSDQAAIAQAALDQAHAWQPLEAGSPRFKLEFGRAERLFGARRYAQARSAFDSLRGVAGGDDQELATLRLAECDHYLRRFRAAHDALEPFIRSASRRAEAQFFYLTATRELGDRSEYVRLSRELVAAFPNDSWAEETLNNLATHFILTNDDDAADGVFREIFEHYPASRHAQRAGWKVGWSAYRRADYLTAIAVFEQSATRFPRSDFRPAWLYWTARAHQAVGHRDAAMARYRVVLADYQNSYYGRLTAKALGDDANPAPAVTPTSGTMDAATDAPGLPPTHDLVRQLIALELYDDAMNELQYAQRTWGDSPAIQATIGLVYSRTGELRRGINAMKRAYPQYIAAGGEQLPPEMLKVLFPVAYLDLIKKYAAARDLDPYLVSALMAQESTFDPEIKSGANAVGLMQVLPSTGRRYAKRLGIKRFRPSMLTTPELNIRLGTAIFGDLVARFGNVHEALASYNAGEGAVARWASERPGITREEFVDDIPYPETQNYVKKIVGTAEDYRRLYGTLGATPGRPAVSHAVDVSSETVTAPTHARRKATAAKKKQKPSRAPAPKRRHHR